MRSGVIILLLILLSITSSSSQKVHYGYPAARKITKGDIIILSVPKYLHARLEEDEDILELTEFINNNSVFAFKISISFFFETEDFDMKFSKRLADSLLGILEKRCRSSKTEVLEIGQNDPIFLNKESPLFSKMNTRLEIRIE